MDMGEDDVVDPVGRIAGGHQRRRQPPGRRAQEGARPGIDENEPLAGVDEDGVDRRSTGERRKAAAKPSSTRSGLVLL